MKKLFIIVAVALVGMASCSTEGPSTEVKGSGNVEITLLDANASATRADLTTNPDGAPVVGSAAENKISSIEMFGFDNTGENLDEETIDGDGYISMDIANTVAFPYKTQVKMGAGESKDIIVVANANIGEPEEGDTFDDIMGKIHTALLNNTNSTVVPTDGFVMTGYVLDAEVTEGNNNKIAVAMDRVVARIEYPTAAAAVVVTLDADELKEVYGEEATAVDLGAVSFTLDGFAVINGLSKSSIGFVGNKVYEGENDETVYSVYDKPLHSPGIDEEDEFEWDLWEESVTEDGVKTEGAAVTARGPRSTTNANSLMADGIPGAATEWTGAYSGNAFLTSATPAVYVYENKPDWIITEGLAGYDTDGIIALIVKGTLTPANTAEYDAETRYWRVNVRAQNAYHVLRNSSYHTAINTIITPGYKTPQEAEEEKPIIPIDGEISAEFTISINPWVHREVGPGQL